jgi:hypothetical protein
VEWIMDGIWCLWSAACQTLQLRTACFFIWQIHRQKDFWRERMFLSSFFLREEQVS